VFCAVVPPKVLTKQLRAHQRRCDCICGYLEQGEIDWLRPDTLVSPSLVQGETVTRFNWFTGDALVCLRPEETHARDRLDELQILIDTERQRRALEDQKEPGR